MKNRIPTLLTAGLLAGGAYAQTLTLPATPIVSPPSAPTGLTQGDLEARHLGATPFVLQWTQIIPNGPGLWLYPPATHFIVCFRAYSGGSVPACSLTSHDFREVIAMPTPRLVAAGSVFRFTPSAGGVPETLLDRPYRLTVGACSAWLERSCRYTSADVFYSTRNLVAHEAQEATSSTNTHWRIDARASNTGDSAIPKINVTMELFEVLYRGNPGRTCETDVDHDSRRYDPTLVVLDKNGGRTPIVMVSRDPVTGLYNGPQVAGIFRQGNFAISENLPTLNPSIDANSPERGIQPFDFPVATGPVQRPFVIVTTLDSSYVVREFNENDNSRAKCRVRDTTP